jgi:hypothetical protein
MTVEPQGDPASNEEHGHAQQSETNQIKRGAFVILAPLTTPTTPKGPSVVTTAYEDVLATLGLERRTDPLTQMIARKIIEHAQRGERDPIRLRESVLKELEGAGREGQ